MNYKEEPMTLAGLLEELQGVSAEKLSDQDLARFCMALEQVIPQLEDASRENYMLIPTLQYCRCRHEQIKKEMDKRGLKILRIDLQKIYQALQEDPQAVFDVMSEIPFADLLEYVDAFSAIDDEDIKHLFMKLLDWEIKRRYGIAPNGKCS